MVAGAGGSSTMAMSGSRLQWSSSKREWKNRRICGFKETDALGVRKAIDKKKKYGRKQKKVEVFDLSALSDSLPKIEAPDQPSMFILQVTRKKKKKLILSRMNKGIQVGNFVYHSAFLPDTVASIHPHLQNTQFVFFRGQVTSYSKIKKRRFKKSIASASLPQAMECC